MKVGILTLTFGGNYGGILQNWALQQALNRLGHKAVTIMHQRASGRIPCLQYAFAQLCSDFLGIDLPDGNGALTRSPALMQEFIETQISQSPNMPVFTRKRLQALKLDAVIVGSDQVWRRGYNVFTQEMYLRFVRGMGIRRIAYAASFGNSDWNYPGWLTALCRCGIQRFDAVSCREYRGVDFCRDHFGIEATVALDPTLLLDKADYEALCCDIERPLKPYLLAFVLDDSSTKRSFIEAEAHRLGFDVRYVFDSTRHTLSIPQWLAAFRDASFVITDSFHGTVFSIIFERQFLTILNSKRGAARFDTLRQLFGIEQHIIDFLDSPSEISNLPMVQFDDIKSNLRKLRKQSFEFIQNSLD